MEHSLLTLAMLYVLQLATMETISRGLTKFAANIKEI